MEQIFPEKELRGLSPNFHIHLMHCTENIMYVLPEKELRSLSPSPTFVCLWEIYTVYSQDRSTYLAAGNI